MRRSGQIQREAKPVPFWGAVVTFLFLVAIIIALSVGLKTPPHIPLMIATVFAAMIGAIYGFKWHDMQDGISETIKAALPAILIIMTIGVLIGTWMMGGIIPTMVYYGLQIISPRFFLVTTLLLCSLVSLAIGSSLSTIGTVGVALFGIGTAMGMPPAITVGAIVSGAYFGDKMSPLSDTTNLAPSVSGADVFDHIRHMMVTTVPTYIICILIYGGIGLFYGSGSVDAENVSLITTTLSQNFHISPILLLPPLLVIVMVIFRIPALPGLMGAAFLGILAAVFYQGGNLGEICSVMLNGSVGNTGVEAVDTLLTRGGILGMMKTVALAVISLSYAGIFERTGMAKALVSKVLARVKSDRGLVISTILTAWAILIGTGQQYVAIIITGRLFRSLYEERGLAPRNLSRALEDAGTVFGGIVPHSTGAGFTENALGISAWQYGPFTFFGWINPLMAILIAAMGKSIPHVKKISKG